MKNLEINGVSAKFIGSGCYSKAYRNGEDVYIVTNDPAKESVALWSKNGTKHIPIIVWVGRNKCFKNIYKMPLYKRLTKKDYPRAYAMWETLPQCKVSYDIATKLVSCASIEPSLAEAIEELVYGMTNYTNKFHLEFNKGNVGVDHNGELILRDCVVCDDAAYFYPRRKVSKRELAFPVFINTGVTNEPV